VPFCYFIRQFYYWLLPAFGNPWAVLPVQFLHGVTFGLYWSTANDFIQDISPFGLSASMTGLFSAVNSAGGFSGAVLGGMAYDAFGGGGLFLGVGLINLCLGVFFTALKLRSDRANAVAYVLLESESTEEANAL
jgi:predicted MFS family arabinose efflux permease